MLTMARTTATMPRGPTVCPLATRRRPRAVASGTFRRNLLKVRHAPPSPATSSPQTVIHITGHPAAHSVLRGIASDPAARRLFVAKELRERAGCCISGLDAVCPAPATNLLLDKLTDEVLVLASDAATTAASHRCRCIARAVQGVRRRSRAFPCRAPRYARDDVRLTRRCRRRARGGHARRCLRVRSPVPRPFCSRHQSEVCVPFGGPAGVRLLQSRQLGATRACGAASAGRARRARR